jgi:hypothetical protein
VWVKVICAVVLFSISCGNVFASGVHGKFDAGWSTLLQPDIQTVGARKGGFTAIVQGLLGDNSLKYGAELGFFEAYTSWNKNTLELDKSLVLISPLGALQYDFSQGRVIPYLGLSAGPYFAIEQFQRNINGTNDSSASSRAFGGASLSAGLKINISAKNSIDFSYRYTRIPSEDISIVSFYAGLAWPNITFFKPDKAGRMQLRIKDPDQPKQEN